MTIRPCHTLSLLTGTLVDMLFDARFRALKVEVGGYGFVGASWTWMTEDFMIPSYDCVDERSWDTYFLLEKNESLTINVELLVSICIEESLKCGVVVLVLCYDGIVDGTNIIVIVVSNIDGV